MSDPCAFGDRHCTLPPPQKLPCVWVGPKDGKWVKVVDAEDVDSSAPVPCPPAGAPGDHDASIVFVAIAAFRDSLCATTLEGLFGRAEYPERVRVAVVQQNKPEDDDCYEAYCAKARASRASATTRPAPTATTFRSSGSRRRGERAAWARRDADMLPDDAEFCLRTDSHMAFANDWDTKQIAQWPRPRGSWKAQAHDAVGAGLVFRCHAERAVPYDPHTPYIFWGEEFSRTARFFTNGYDIYTPRGPSSRRDYKHTQGDPSHFKWNGKGGPRLNQNKTIVAQRDAANRRIWTLLGMPGGDPDPRRRLGATVSATSGRSTTSEFVSFEQMAAQRAIKSVMHHKHPRGADAAPAHTADNAPIPPTTVLLGLLGLWTAVKALNVIFRGKSKRQALGLPVAKVV
ncbi:glycosyltransferase [Aureococcus anophagefferens]|nr:glycosyltransferase [Aureococcus anophagefferens]